MWGEEDYPQRVILERWKFSSVDCGGGFTLENHQTHVGCVLELCLLILCVHGVWALVPRHMYGTRERLCEAGFFFCHLDTSSGDQVARPTVGAVV